MLCSMCHVTHLACTLAAQQAFARCRLTAPVLIAIASLSFSQQQQNASVYDVEVAVAAPAIFCSTRSLLCD